MILYYSAFVYFGVLKAQKLIALLAQIFSLGLGLYPFILMFIMREKVIVFLSSIRSCIFQENELFSQTLLVYRTFKVI